MFSGVCVFACCMQLASVSLVRIQQGILNVTGAQLQHTGYKIAVRIGECVDARLHAVVWVLQTVRMIQQDDSYSY